MSVRASAAWPSSCSGAMYWKVPTIVPSSVRGWSAVFRDEIDATAAFPSAGRARPKSSSFAPARVIMTLPGFKSRCTIPRRCAASRAEADLHAVAQEVLHRQGSLREPLRERLAVDQLEHEVVQLLAPNRLAPDVVERADVGVVEGGDALRLALEARLELGVGGEVRGEELQGHVAIEAGVPGLVDLAHAAGPELRRDLVGPEPAGQGKA